MFTFNSFCTAVLKVPHSIVNQCITKDDYKEFELRTKKNSRIINYLDRESKLWKLQSNLLVNFLEKQSFPVCVKGFIKGESYRLYLKEHIGKKYYLRVDIESFFSSITDTLIKRELTNIIFCSTDMEKETLLNLIVDIVTLNNTLPQGACTSPSVSNIVMARVDQRITKYCQVLNIKYTRYADDLLFSSDKFNFYEKRWFIKKIKHILNFLSLKLNYSKTKYSQDELILNGYVIYSNGIRLSRKRLSDIRRVVSFVKKNVEIHKKSDLFLTEVNKIPLRHRNLNEYPFKTIFQLTQYMCGYRAYLISMVDNDFCDSPFQKDLQKLIQNTEIAIMKLD